MKRNHGAILTMKQSPVLSLYAHSLKKSSIIFKNKIYSCFRLTLFE